MSRAELVRAQRKAARGERFTAVMAACVRRLPFRLAGIPAPVSRDPGGSSHTLPL